MGPVVVYIAGPYTKPDPMLNIHNAVQWANRFLDDGYVPIVPHLTGLWHVITPRVYTDWLEYDLHVMRRCDAVFRLKGESSGSDAEIVEAEKIGLPVFYKYKKFQKWAKKHAV